MAFVAVDKLQIWSEGALLWKIFCFKSKIDLQFLLFHIVSKQL